MKILENKDWLNNLEDKTTSNVKKYLEILDIDFSNQIKILVSGNSFRVTTLTTLKEVLNTKKFYSGTIEFNSEVENAISYKNRRIDDESLEFHIGCIKTIYEENNLEIGYNEAIFLAGLNFFREQKAPIIIVEDAFDFVNEIDYNHKLLTDYIEDKSIYSYNKLNEKDIYLYKSELCSFSYKNLDYDVLNYGSFNAYSYILALSFLEDYYPELKSKKTRKIVNDIKPNLIYERVNLNPRIILHYITSDSDLETSINNLKNITDRNIVTISNLESDLVNHTIRDTNELKDIINGVSSSDIVFIVFNKFFVKDIRRFFIN